MSASVNFLLITISVIINICANESAEVMKVSMKGIQDQSAAASGYSYQIEAHLQPQFHQYSPESLEILETVGGGSDGDVHLEPLIESEFHHHPLSQLHDSAEMDGDQYSKSSGSSEATSRIDGSVRGGNSFAKQNSAGHHDETSYQGESNKEANEGQLNAHEHSTRTSGYRNQHHKNEVHREHTDYDNAERKGYFRRWGKFGAKHSGEEGAYQKGSSHDAAHDKEGHSVEGIQDKAVFDTGEKKSESEGGQEGHVERFNKFDNRESRILSVQN